MPAQAFLEKSHGRMILKRGDAHHEARFSSPVVFQFFISSPTIHPSSEMMRDMKIHLASWRHSADTGANACRSKVIDGRFYDACVWSLLSCGTFAGRAPAMSSAILPGFSTARIRNPGVTYLANKRLVPHLWLVRCHDACHDAPA